MQLFVCKLQSSTVEACCTLVADSGESNSTKSDPLKSLLSGLRLSRTALTPPKVPKKAVRLSSVQSNGRGFA